ncbi:putative uncharacterized protein [Dorea formicigenerans CAG:28]|uniref:YveK family protein n=1 Tax=Veillonella sp. CAG:933 TaxID=1262980 RepID=UPI00033853A3|nr:Wzz/FepE/Etk N-terminal domain-containing protein [Veillonella sp. CAG:933]CCX53894.1 putative uncharacterized protein [Veillonella sp. CAG:933]CDC58930.1 putative uncharacterized protein [Dorea formicigenerans CAG:28]
MGKNYDNDEMEIDLLELFYVLKSKILAILGVGLLFGCIACAYAGFLVKPLYTSSSMMLVLTKETTLSSLADLQMGSQLTKDYSILITSRPVLTDVIDQLDLDMDYKQLKDIITVANQDDTRILQLSVEYSDAKQAKEIVDKLSEVASEYIGDKMEVTPPKIIEKGEVPTSRSNTGVAKMAVMGVLAGMILCAGVIVVRTIMDDTIKSEEDIEKYLGLSTLSVIPDRKDYINGSGKKKSKRNDAGKRKAS